MNVQSIITYLRNLYQAVQKDDVSSLGAQLSYYFILSVFPFLIFLITLLDYTPLTQQHTIDELSILLPEPAFVIIKEILTEVAAADNFTLLSLGILGKSGKNADSIDRKERPAFCYPISPVNRFNQSCTTPGSRPDCTQDTQGE